MSKKMFVLLAAALTAVFAFGGSTVYQASAISSYTNYPSVSAGSSGLQLEPTLVYEATAFSEITQNYLQSPRPASLVLTPDEDMNVTLGESTMTLASAFDSFLKGKFIPVLRLSAATVQPFVQWMKETYTITDIMVLSSEIGVLETLYSDEVCYLVNTIYDLTEQTIPSDRYDLWEYIGEANAAGCNVLMFDAADPNIAVASDYVSAMAKSCWAYAENRTEGIAAVAAGCYGIVSADASVLRESLSVFTENGFARAQHVAAHRGITAYANENSLTAVAASANEGATHVEIDVQVTADGEIVLCHNSQTNGTANISGWYFASVPLERLRTLFLEDYSRKYEETYPTLDEVIEVLSKTDVILILELKLDGGSSKAVDELGAIQRIKEVMERHPEFEGHWFAITFYAPYAEGMREYMPEIPVGFLGGATSGKESENGQSGWGGGWTGMTNIASKIAFLRKYNIVLDETYENSTNTMAQAYLARGYVQNTWTFSDPSHFFSKANIATTDAAEECAMFVKEISAPASIEEATIAAGSVNVSCTTYCGWQVQRECKIIEVGRGDGTVQLLLYAEQDTGNGTYGLYSTLFTVSLQ